MLNTQIGAKRSWNGQYTVECSKVPSLPALSFHFGGYPYVLEGSDYILNVQGTCISAFTGLDLNLPGGSLWVIGMYLVQVNLNFDANTPCQVMFSSASTSPSTILAGMLSVLHCRLSSVILSTSSSFPVPDVRDSLLSTWLLCTLRLGCNAYERLLSCLLAFVRYKSFSQFVSHDSKSST